jgi:dUTP pyrophosphatase
MVVKIKNTSSFPLPQYATPGSAGLDVRAFLDVDIIIAPMERVMIGTGIFLELPDGIECQVRPRSGLAAKHGITVLNTPGTIDSDYRGEIKIILINLSHQTYRVAPGERIAQLVFSKYEQILWEETHEIGETHRGTGGFGHTGNK